ncbi:MAG: putative O-succinylbenzoate--CoA ligase [Acidimicrobiia bacterium]|nr:putative O-succinylbenzoate--CoA ligase [Acidimicrobiia bacterium]
MPTVTDVFTEKPDSSLWELVEQRAEDSGDRLFAVDEHGRSLTFAELRDACNRVAAALAERGVGNGTVVSWQLPTRLESITLMLALRRLGAIQNPIIPILRAREVGFISRQARTELLVVAGQWRGFDYGAMAEGLVANGCEFDILVADPDLPQGSASDVPPPAGSHDDVRWYYYTSGTTADPKGAKHTDDTLIAASRLFVDGLELRAEDRMSLVLPITHVGGIIHVVASLLTGCAALCAESFSPDQTTRQLRDQHATVLPGSVPFVQAFFDFQDQHPELEPLFPDGRISTHGGSPKPPHMHYEVQRRLHIRGTISGYGMTECPMLAWCTPADSDEDIAHTEGRPGAGVEVVIMESETEVAGPGGEGELRVRGPQLMKGYVDSSLDADAFDDLGYFRTGDVGRFGPRGHLTITGRLKDIIIRNMENISATELENLIYPHPKVLHVAVIGVPDAKTGERVCAVVVPVDAGDPPTLLELRNFLLETGLSDRKLPERLELVADLPRNAMEKVQKAELRRIFQAPQGAES